MAVSWSRINTFKYCPRKYYFRYRKNLEDSPSEAMLKGRAVHRALEYYLKNEEKLGLLELGNLPTEDLEDARIAYRLGKKLIDAIQPLAVELQFAVNDDWRFVPFDDPGALFRGVVDLVTVENEGIGIWDWKTGWATPDPTQIQMYAAALIANDKEVVRGGYYLLNSGALLDIDLEAEDILLAKNLVIRYGKELTTRDDLEESWPQNFNSCGWCDFRERCRGTTKEKSFQEALLMRAEANDRMKAARKATVEAGGRLNLGDGCQFELEESKVLKPKAEDKKALIEFLLEHGYDEFINIKESTPPGVFGKAPKELKSKARYNTSISLKVSKKEG